MSTASQFGFGFQGFPSTGAVTCLGEELVSADFQTRTLSSTCRTEFSFQLVFEGLEN